MCLWKDQDWCAATQSLNLELQESRSSSSNSPGAPILCSRWLSNYSTHGVSHFDEPDATLGEALENAGRHVGVVVEIPVDE